MPRIVFKNQTSGQKQTVSFSTQDTTFYTSGREELVCGGLEEVTEEEVLIELNPTGLSELHGDISRFVKVAYVKGALAPPSVEDMFREQFTGITKSMQYKGLTTNVTKNNFFDSSNPVLLASGAVKSVCTSSQYLAIVKNYSINISQNIQNRLLNEYIKSVNVVIDPSGSASHSVRVAENFDSLYFSGTDLIPNQITCGFYGSSTLGVSNNFWILPNQFKTKGITYELYHDGNPSPAFNNVSEFTNMGLGFIISNDICTFTTSSLSFSSYAFIGGNELIIGDMDDYTFSVTDVDVSGALSYTSVITASHTLVSTGALQHKFSIINNIAEGLTGYYHQLDDTKTRTNGLGFYEDGLYKRTEQLGDFIAKSTNISWFSSIISAAAAEYSTGGESVSSLYNTALVANSAYTNSFTIVNGRYEFLDVSNAVTGKSVGPNRDFHRFRFENVDFSGSIINACNFSNASFINCNFSYCSFRACTFTDLYTKKNVWYNYQTDLDNNINGLPYGYKFINGYIFGPDISYKESFATATGAVRLFDNFNDLSNTILDKLDQVGYNTANISYTPALFDTLQDFRTNFRTKLQDVSNNGSLVSYIPFNGDFIPTIAYIDSKEYTDASAVKVYTLGGTEIANTVDFSNTTLIEVVDLVKFQNSARSSNAQFTSTTSYFNTMDFTSSSTYTVYDSGDLTLALNPRPTTWTSDHVIELNGIVKFRNIERSTGQNVTTTFHKLNDTIIDATSGIKHIYDFTLRNATNLFTLRSIAELDEGVALKFNSGQFVPNTTDQLGPIMEPAVIMSSEPDNTSYLDNTIYDRIIIPDLVEASTEYISFLNKYAIYYNVFDARPSDNKRIDEKFYDFQFQKAFTSGKRIKLFGYNNLSDKDDVHFGSWTIAKFPYNIISQSDVFIQHTQESLTEQFGTTIPDWQEGATPGTKMINVGPLPYNKLDVSYNDVAWKTPNGSATNFKLRKVNLNYNYVDRISKQSAQLKQDIYFTSEVSITSATSPSTAPDVGPPFFTALNDL